MTQAPDNKTPTSEIDRLRSTFERLVTSLSSDVQPGHPIGTSDNIDDTFDALILHASHATQEEIDALPVLVNVAEGTSNAAPDEDEGDFGKEVRQGVKDFLNGMLAERDFGGRHGRRGCFPPGRPPCGGPFERHGPPPPPPCERGPFGRGRGPFGHPHMHGPHSRFPHHMHPHPPHHGGPMMPEEDFDYEMSRPPRYGPHFPHSHGSHHHGPYPGSPWHHGPPFHGHHAPGEGHRGRRHRSPSPGDRPPCRRGGRRHHSPPAHQVEEEGWQY